MAAGLFGGVTTATATMRTVANIKFGGKTPLASIVHGLTLLAILLGLGSLVAKIPAACLAAILFKVGIEILDYRIMPLINKLPLKDLIIFCTVLFVTVYEDLMIAIAIGIVFAVLSSLKDLKSVFKERGDYQYLNISDSDYSIGLKLKSANGNIINVLSPSGPLFFGSVEKLIKSYNQIPSESNVIIDMKNITNIDLTGVFGLEDLIKLSQNQNRKVIIANMDENIKRSFNDLRAIENIGFENLCESTKEAVQKINSSSF